jgi:1,2-phenylacetyl-CoA epoxidase catalytic subunit
MPDLTLTLTDAQIKVLRRMDTTKTAKQVLQAHVDTFLLPLVQALITEDREGVKTAYTKASPEIQAQVRQVLGLG